MVEQSVEHCDPAERVGPKQHGERPQVPSGERSHASAIPGVVPSDAVIIEVIAIPLVIQVVRFSQLGQKSTAILRECSVGQ